MLFMVLAALALQDTPSAAAVAQEPPTSAQLAVLENPRWVRYPRLSFGSSTRSRSRAGPPPVGRVEVDCRATTEGRLDDCRILSDTSQSRRLSRAALNAAREAEVEPRRVDGQPTPTRVVFSLMVAPPE